MTGINTVKTVFYPKKGSMYALNQGVGMESEEWTCGGGKWPMVQVTIRRLEGVSESEPAFEKFDEFGHL